MIAPVEETVVVAGLVRDGVRKAERVDGKMDGRRGVMEENALMKRSVACAQF